MIIISILVYNKCELTQKCLESIFANTDRSNVRIVVSDNGSTDNTIPYLESLKDKIWLVKNEKNLGFAAAHNQIMRVFGDSDTVLLNNDITVPKDWLTMLTETLKQGFGAVSPAIQTPNGLDIGAVLDGNARGKSIINDTTIVPTWITGSCLYIARETMNKIGLLDDKTYFFYYEDVDYCVCMKRKNIPFKCDTRVVIQHLNASSSTPAWKKEKMEESRMAFVNKWSWHG